MNGNKRTWAVFAGLLMAASCVFEISETSRFISMIAAGNKAYVGELVIKIIYMASLIVSGVLFVLGKAGHGTAVCLTVAGGASLYKAFSYIVSIMGNEMIFGIVFGNIIDMIKAVLFIIPTAVLLINTDKVSKSSVRGCLIAELMDLVTGVLGSIASFIGWGKNLAYDIALFFEVYILDLLCTAVLFCAFALSILSLAPEERKNADKF